MTLGRNEVDLFYNAPRSPHGALLALLSCSSRTCIPEDLTFSGNELKWKDVLLSGRSRWEREPDASARTPRRDTRRWRRSSVDDGRRSTRGDLPQSTGRASPGRRVGLSGSSPSRVVGWRSSAAGDTSNTRPLTLILTWSWLTDDELMMSSDGCCDCWSAKELFLMSAALSTSSLLVGGFSSVVFTLRYRKTRRIQRSTY